MATKLSCRCCLLRPPDKDLKMPYTRLGITEIYADMLKECFEIHLTTLSSNGDCGICDVCVGRLRDASDFKLQVQRSQAELQARLQGALHVKEEELLVKSEMSEDGVDGEAPMHQEVKPEVSEDPLPNDGSQVFMEFVLNNSVPDLVNEFDKRSAGDVNQIFEDCDFENQVSSVWKQEPLFEFAPISEPRSRLSVRSKGVGLDYESKLGKDKKIKKENPGNTCETCGKQFTQKTKLAHHKRIHLGERYNCLLCNVQFKFKCHLDLHNRRFHVGEKPYNCDICYKKFGTSRALYKHKHVHIGKRYRCGECDRLFSNPHNLKSHKRTHTGEIPYNCDMCGAKFKIKRALIAHMGRHMGQMNFRCEYCSTNFWDYGSLLVHKRIHVEDSQNYSCDVCNKVFAFKSRLVTHMKTHTERKYPCEFCTAELATLGSLKQHKLTHTGEKAYPCEYCNKQFRYKHNLTAHLHIHTGEKPHCCEVCGKQFGRKDNLKTHLEIHAEGKRYQCELCTKSYPTKEGLRQHRRTHTKEKTVTKSSKRQKIEYIGNIIP